MYGMFIKYVMSSLGCLRLPMVVNSPLNSMGIYTVFDRTPLPRIGDSTNGLHTDLKFQNQVRERELHLSNVYATMRVYYSIN